MRPKSNKRKSNKRKIVPGVELDDFPFSRLFAAFFQAIKTLEADHDTVNGIAREYLSTYSLFPLYRECFGTEGLVLTTIGHRLRQLNPEEFPDDLIVLNEDVRQREAKYFVNRLNRKLLEKIYLPVPNKELRELLENIKLLQEDLKFLQEFEEEDDDRLYIDLLDQEP